MVPQEDIWWAHPAVPCCKMCSTGLLGMKILSLVEWLLPALLPVTTTCHVVEQLEGLSIQSLGNLLLMFRQGFRRLSSSTRVK